MWCSELSKNIIYTPSPQKVADTCSPRNLHPCRPTWVSKNDKKLVEIGAYDHNRTNCTTKDCLNFHQIHVFAPLAWFRRSILKVDLSDFVKLF